MFSPFLASTPNLMHLQIALNLATLLLMANQDLDPIPNPDPETLDLLAESLPGVRPAKRTPEEGVAEMQRHLRALRTELCHFLESDPEDQGGDIAKIEKDIRDVEARLREYETQRDSRN